MRAPYHGPTTCTGRTDRRVLRTGTTGRIRSDCRVAGGRGQHDWLIGAARQGPAASSAACRCAADRHFGRLPVRIRLFQPRVDSDDYLVEAVHDEELDTALRVDLESTTGTPCKRVAHARSIGYGRRRDLVAKNRQISPSEHPVEAVRHKAEMGSRQELPPTDCSPALGAIGVERRKDRFLGLQVRVGYPNAQGKSIAPRGLVRG